MHSLAETYVPSDPSVRIEGSVSVLPVRLDRDIPLVHIRGFPKVSLPVIGAQRRPVSILEPQAEAPTRTTTGEHTAHRLPRLDRPHKTSRQLGATSHVDRVRDHTDVPLVKDCGGAETALAILCADGGPTAIVAPQHHPSRASPATQRPVHGLSRQDLVDDLTTVHVTTDFNSARRHIDVPLIHHGKTQISVSRLDVLREVRQQVRAVHMAPATFPINTINTIKTLN
mmetsp:Transcript_27498/g.72440  ORF Transcript_27498/g.72440 Transcript_27498/m.72440 type:complete len:227 (-) Transcript_27498:83-763(-)